ncbi:flavin monoamine oxidase family protein [Paracnuella aquatica]|uniref:flavin monoamine oxidase family protein n=1 Tax=Paracnuella aquatica TaxID=2268757 RepID=UPI000DEEF5EC|nr:NAD(P)/FAD-dependent oxidoreductase [Paracnuella aquatica]RPD50916.1 FAD-dependent oxidoreductase [Paracnuella aquatica]
MTKAQFDIVIVGAGAAGLMAAIELSSAGKRVAVVEATSRTGGRMLCVQDKDTGTLVQLGAEFVHGSLPLTQSLLQQAGATTHQIEGSIWQRKEAGLQPQQDFIEGYDILEPKLKAVTTDLPVQEFIQRQLAGPQCANMRQEVQDYAEGYYAADTNRSSTLALAEELTGDDQPQYRIEGGYLQLAQYMEAQCREKGVQFFLGQPVEQIDWQRENVSVTTDKTLFKCSQLLVTVSLGVLQSGSIKFVPALPQYDAAAKALGYGHVVKINLLFRQAFWKRSTLVGGQNLADLQFLFSEESIPTWWSQHPLNTNILTGWLGGPKAQALQHASHDELLQLALSSLTKIFDLEPAYLWQDLKAAWSHNWSADPFFHGAYSYEVVDGATHQKTLQQPAEHTVYFAGEALHHGPELGTVEAALQSGKQAAAAMLSAGNEVPETTGQ